MQDFQFCPFGSKTTGTRQTRGLLGAKATRLSIMLQQLLGKGRLPNETNGNNKKQVRFVSVKAEHHYYPS